jgi:uncharacterized membrane protein (UPF0136 family)
MKQEDVNIIIGLTLAFAGLSYYSTRSIPSLIIGASKGAVFGTVLAASLRVLKSENI